MASRMVRMSQLEATPSSNIRRSHSMETFMVRVYPGTLSDSTDFLCVEALKNTSASDIVKVAAQKLRLSSPDSYELAETFSSGGQLCKERRLEPIENPVRIQLLWPRVSQTSEAHRTEYHFYLRKKEADRKVGTWVEYDSNNSVENFLSTFLQQPKSKKEYQDLCNLPDLNENTLLNSLESRFQNGNIYTYVGSILISVNPFKFYPIYNPKYVKLYQNRRLGDLPPHIFAIADAAYHTMLHRKQNQCIVISGESGSGKTESTNLLLHHLSALSQRGLHGSGIENTILGGGPVLEAFGNAKTVHNNNSSRFGKFIQVNYKENGMVHGAVVEKYLLEKSRIVSQAESERNYHVFYYLLAGITDLELDAYGLQRAPETYFYLNQGNRHKCYTLESIDGENIDEGYEFTRLKQSMEMVGFPVDTQRRIFGVLAAVLHLGNIEFKKKADHHHHEAVTIKNIGTVKTISNLLKVKESTLIEAMTKKKTTAGGETVVMNYNMQDAVATRDAMAKCLYGSLFDWIVLQINHALLAKKDIKEHQGYSIGVLDIFGFEDFGQNSFEQFCINYANERLHYYFNQHIFKFEQEEYVREGIVWKNIEFIDNTACLDLFSKKPTGLLYLLDEECNFPGATNDTLLAKFHAQHQNNTYYEAPQMRENAFSIVHYAGKVKYIIQDFRHKNSDLMRHDLMLVLKNSSQAFVRELVGYDPVAVLRWAIVRAFFRAYFAFLDAGRRHNQSPASKFGAVLRSQNQLPKQHSLQGTGDSRFSDHKNLNLEERKSRKHVSYHGELINNLDLENGQPEEDYGMGSMRVMHEDENFVNDSRAMRRASKVLTKSRSFKPKVRMTKSFRDLKAMKTLAGKQYIMPRSSKGKNKPPSVSAQFNYSLSKLMETLCQANPFFIRCIKSNADKAPCKFDEELVLRQLRYTGMLATVKIRQSGYNYRLTFEEFIQQYKILLPKGLLSSKDDVKHFLQQLDLNSENYQIGKSKVFLRETEKMLLDDALHRAIMERIVHIQRWMRSRLERQRFLRIRWAVVTIQTVVRGFLARRRYSNIQLQFYACLLIQRVFRGFRLRKQMALQHRCASVIQRNYRGHLARTRVCRLREERALEYKRQEEERIRLEREEQERLRLEQEEQERAMMALSQKAKDDMDAVPKTEDMSTPVKSEFDNLESIEEVKRKRRTPAETYAGETEVHVKASKYEVFEPAETNTVFMSRARAYLVRETDSKMTSRPETPEDKSPRTLKFKGEEGLISSSPKTLTFEVDDTVPGVPPRSPSYQSSDFEPEVLCSSSMYNVKSPHTQIRDLDQSSSSLYLDFVMPAERRRADESSNQEEVFYSGGRERLEEARPPGETVDLHSSASDEGVLTKESSTEELIDKEEPDTKDGHESEESSGILDDSESEITSCESGQKSRATSFTTPPSTPQSPFTSVSVRPPIPHHMPPICPLEEGPVWVRRNRESGPKLVLPKAQHGPQDLEIHVTAAIQRALSIESNLSSSSLETSASIVWKEKRIMAPLAKQESITESISESFLAEDERSLTGSVTSSITSLSLNEEMPSNAGDMASLKVESGAGDLGATNLLGTTHLSPFHRAKKHLKNFMGEEAQDMSQGSEFNRQGTRRMVLMRSKSESKRRSFKDLMRPSSGSLRLSPSEEIKAPLSSKKTSSTTSLMRYSKMSFKSLLEHRTGKKHPKKDAGEESDESVSEDPPSSPPIIREDVSNIYLGKAAPANKQKENRLSVEDQMQPSRKKHRRKNSKRQNKEEKKREESWQVSSTSQWQYPTTVLIHDYAELSNMEVFLSEKINELSKDTGRRDTIFDKVFKAAVKEFHEAVITVKAAQDATVEYRYKDLMVMFENSLKARAKDENLDEDFPATMGINAFRGFLDEFNKPRPITSKHEQTKDKKKKKGNRHGEEKKEQPVTEHAGHRYLSVQFSIPTYCELCSHLIWMVEKGFVCQSCKYTVHKKCCIKSLEKCKFPRGRPGSYKRGQKVFGAPLTSLLADEDMKVPAIIEKLFCAIEVDGLYTVGVYRKPGHAAKIKQLINAINTHGENVDFSEYSIYVLTSVMKSFFREMPEPLMTYELYDDYIRAAECADKKERIQLLYSVIEKLPESNYYLLKRLIFHLAKIAQHEDHNRMSSSSLAIVFAPGIIRCDRQLPAQQSLEHVPKLNFCMENIIEEQLQKLKLTLADIKTLDTATASATDRLNSVRASIRTASLQAGDSLDTGMRDVSSIPERPENKDALAEEQMLAQQIMSLQQEKEMLTIQLPSFRHSSSEEDILSTEELDSTADDLDDLDNEELAITFDIPAVSPPKNMRHLTKCRVSTPTKRPPKKKKAPMLSSPDLQSQSLGLKDFKQYGDEILV